MPFPTILHALCNMLGDGLVPSNAKAGYLARMLARKTLRMRDDLGLKVSLAELSHPPSSNQFGGGKMKQTSDGLIENINLEEERYVEMLRKGQNVIHTQLAKGSQDANEIPDEVLFNLNDSHGLTP